MVRPVRALMLIALTVLIGSCATTHEARRRSRSNLGGPMAPRESSGGTLSARELREYKEIYQLYTSGAYEAALPKLAAFEKRHPRSAKTQEIQNLHGLCYVMLKKPSEAVQHFRRAIRPGVAYNAFNQYILYNLSKAYFDANQLDPAQKVLDQVELDLIDKENRIKVHYLKARIFSARGLHLEAARESLAASRLFSGMEVQAARESKSTFITLLEQSLQEITSIPILEELSHEYEDSPLADMVLFRLATQELATGSSEKGQTYLQTLMSRYPQSLYYSRAAEVLTNAEKQVVIDPKAVGVLLPLKGKFAKYGNSSLHAIEMAFGIFNSAEPDSKVTLHIEDSGEDPETAIRGLNRLVGREHVIAVIGPLLSKGIDQITQRAQELGVPLLTLARYPGVSGDYIFPAGLTLKLQTEEIARYAVEKLGVHHFAMVYPHDKIGAETSQYFWDAVESLGGDITGAESYTPDETDFRQPVDKLSGLYYTEARGRELEELAKQREELKIKKRNRRTEQYYNLKPIVDYQAVFVPDEPKVAGQILPTFAYRDVDGVKFLGTSAWNSPEFPARVQSYGERAYFVDAFFAQSASPAVHAFIDQYHTSFGQDPTDMEALAYDAGKIVAAALGAASAAPTRSEVRDQLKAIRDFPGVTGKIRYADGQFMRDLKVLTVHAGRLAEAQ